MQLRALQRPLFGVAFLRQRHQRVGAFHGQLRLLIAGDQPGDLPQRREHAAAEHVGRHQCADAEVAGDDAVDPGDDGRHAGELLDEQRAVGGQRREVARMAVEAGEGAVGAFPFVLALAFGAAGLEGFQAAEGFDQQGLAFGTEAQALLHGVAQAHLNHHGEDDRDRKRQQRNHHQPAAEQADHHQHQHDEGQVDQAGQGDGGEEFAQALEVMNALGKTADGRRPRFHRHAGDAFEQGRGQDHVGFLPGGVQQVRAHHPQHQFETGADQQADGQHPQGRGGLVRHHAVVGLHHEQRHHQAQQVDQETRQNRIAVQPFRQLQGVAKPGLHPWHQRRAQVFEFMPWPGEQGLAAVMFGSSSSRLIHCSPPSASLGRISARPSSPKRRKTAVRPLLSNQQNRQVERGDVFQLAAQQTRLQTGPGRCARQQVQAQALVVPLAARHSGWRD